MTCWNCQADAGTGPQCGACGALQPLPPGSDAFGVLGLPRSWFVEANRVEDAFKDLHRRLHPDRFAQRSPRERRMSLTWATAVNDAVRTLRDPVRRAGYLLEAEGLAVDQPSGPAAGQVPMEFLEEVMEQREALAQARRTRALPAIARLAADVRGRAQSALEALAAQFGEWERTRARSSLESAASIYGILKYYQRFQEEAQAAELEALEQP